MASAGGGDGRPGVGGPVLACQTTEHVSEPHASGMIGEASFLLLHTWGSFKGGVFFWEAPVFTCDLCKVPQARTRSHFMPQTYFLSRQAFLTVDAGGTLD